MEGSDITKGILNYSEDKIKELIQGFKNRKYAFIEDSKTIEEVKESNDNSEFKIFKKYVSDKNLQILFKMGLALRNIENDAEKTESLKNKIKKRFKNQGLHFAYFVQNKLFSKFYASLIERFSEDTINEELNSFTKEIDKNISFISVLDKTSQKTLEITTKINAYSPETFIISSWGNDANKISNKVFNKIFELISNRYKVNEFKENGKLMYMLIRIN